MTIQTDGTADTKPWTAAKVTLSGVTIVKVKKGIPTVLEYQGRRYVLEHPNSFKKE